MLFQGGYFLWLKLPDELSLSCSGKFITYKACDTYHVSLVQNLSKDVKMRRMYSFFLAMLIGMYIMFLLLL